MSERTWEDIGNEIQDDYLRVGGPENVRFREVQWEVWVAEVERAAAEKALTEAAKGWREYTHTAPTSAPCAEWWLLGRAEAYRREGKE